MLFSNVLLKDARFKYKHTHNILGWVAIRLSKPDGNNKYGIVHFVLYGSGVEVGDFFRKMMYLCLCVI